LGSEKPVVWIESNARHRANGNLFNGGMMMVGVWEMIGKSFGNPLAKQGEENGRWNFRIMAAGKPTWICDEMLLEFQQQ